MAGVLLKALGCQLVPRTVNGPRASAGVDLNEVLDPGAGGCSQLISFISALLKR